MEKIARRNMIRLSKSSIGDPEKFAVLQVLEREYLGMGAEVQQFEENLTGFFGRPVVCVANGTAALHLALQASGIGLGDEVIVQSLTYVASFQAISATGATPIACDIDPKTLTMDCRDAESRITQNTKAIMPVHYSGGVGNLQEIYDLAKRHNLRVIEDAAHAFGTFYDGRLVGSFGDIICFSFDGIKNITCGEGGCIVTNDSEVLRKTRDARLLGVEKDTDNRYNNKRSWEFDVSQQGWRYHMSNIMAAIGLMQLKRFNQISTKRKALVNEYRLSLRKIREIEVINSGEDDIVQHIFVVKLRENINREHIRKQLYDFGVETGLHYMPAHMLSKYKLKESQQPLIQVDKLWPRLLTLPLHEDMSIDDINYIVDCLQSSFSKS